MASPHTDEGFSLLEVLFAAFIAFFVLTAVFAVLVTSASEGRIASADVVSTNLAQLVVEQARSLPYVSVGVTPTPAGEIAGTLPASEDTTYQGIGFHIQRDVYWVADPLSPVGAGQDYKRLVVAVSWTGGHATPVTTYIRDHTNETPTPPMVAWTLNPAANSVLFTNAGATQIWDRSSNPTGSAGLASLQASASVVATTGTITRLEIQVNGRVMLWTAASSPSVPPWPNPAYAIDLGLTTVTPSGETTTFFREGLNTIRVVATANNLAYAYQILLVTVDNYPPEFKTGDAVTLIQPSDNTDKYNGSLTMTWTPAMDGADAAPYYNMTVSPAGLTAVPLPGVNLGTAGTILLATGQPPGLTITPFTPYHISLTGVSSRGLIGQTSSSNSGYQCSNVNLTGSVFNQAANKKAGANYRLDLTLSGPNPTEAAVAAAFGGTRIVYDVYSMSAATYVYPGTGDLPITPLPNGSLELLEVADITGSTGVPATTLIPLQSGADCDKYLQVEAKILDSSGTVVKRIRSNVVGPPTSAPAYRQSAVLTIP